MVNPSDSNGPPPLASSDERTWAMLSHLIPALATLASGGTLGFVIVLVIYLLKKDESEFVADAARESLNFQITVFIISIAALILILTAILACIGIPALFLLGFAALIFGIVAALAVHKGERYRYPFCLRLIE